MKKEARPVGPFVVELITGQRLTFHEATAYRRIYSVANTEEEATQFPSKEEAEIRARRELQGGYFNVVDLNAPKPRWEAQRVPMNARREKRIAVNREREKKKIETLAAQKKAQLARELASGSQKKGRK